MKAIKYEQKAFVYGLLDEGKIFYVGVTESIVFRYKQHFSDWLVCGKYIHKMRMAEKYPNVILFGIFKTGKEAQSAEHSLIRCLSFLGVKLCNKHQNPVENYIKCETPGSKEGLKRMPQGLAKTIIDNCLNDYNKFKNGKQK